MAHTQHFEDLTQHFEDLTLHFVDLTQPSPVIPPYMQLVGSANEEYYTSCRPQTDIKMHKVSVSLSVCSPNHHLVLL